MFPSLHPCPHGQVQVITVAQSRLFLSRHLRAVDGERVRLHVPIPSLRKHTPSVAALPMSVEALHACIS